MVQNRNKLIDLFIGNISNSIVHEILEKAIDDKKISNKYSKELNLSLQIAKKYREKINPVNTTLPEKDINYIKSKIINKVRSKLMQRISEGYKNINLNLVETIVDKMLEKTKVS